MSKTKLSGPQHYELLFIVSNRFTEDEAKTSIAKVEKLIADSQGQITLNEYWGKKKLAYPIRHENYGYYQLFELDIEREMLAKLDEKLRLDNEILRFLVVRKPLKSAEQLQKEQKIQDKINSKKIAQEKAAKTKVVEKKESKTKSSAKDKVDLKNLDEKLEGILNANDLL